MVKFAYSLDKYSVKDALLWGNFRGHVAKAKMGTLGNRAVHVMIAAAEILPIVGQVASLIECFVVKVFGSGEMNKPSGASMPPVSVRTGQVGQERTNESRSLTYISPFSTEIHFYSRDRGLRLMLRNEELCTRYNLFNRANIRSDVTGCYQIRLLYNVFPLSFSEMEEGIRSELLQALERSRDPRSSTSVENTVTMRARQARLVDNIVQNFSALLLSRSESDRSITYSDSVPSAENGFVYEINTTITRHYPSDLNDRTIHLDFNLSIEVAFFNDLGQP